MDIPFELIGADEFEALEVALAAAEGSSPSSCNKSKFSISPSLAGSSYMSRRDTSSAAFCETTIPDARIPLSTPNKLVCAPNLHHPGLNTSIGADWQTSCDSLHAAKEGCESPAEVVAAFGNGYEFNEHFENEHSCGLSSRSEDVGDAVRLESATGEGKRAYQVDSSTNANVYNYRDANIFHSDSPINSFKVPSSSELPSKADEATKVSREEAHIGKRTCRRLFSWQSYAGSFRHESLRPVGHTKVNQRLRPGDEEAQLASSSGFPEVPSVDNNRLSWGLAPSTCRVEKCKLPTFQFKGQINYNVTVLKAENAARELLRQVEAKKAADGNLVALGFDMEWKVVFKRGAQPRKVAVLQLCIDADHCDVFHVIHTGIPSPLRNILQDPWVLKIGMGANRDAAKLFRDYSIKVNGVKDLSGLAKLKLAGAARVNKRWSLASLAEELLGKQVDKNRTICMGDWEVEELSEAQLRYAATNAFASLYLFQVLSTFPDPQKEVSPKVGCVT